MKTKDALDQLFDGVEFDAKLFNKLLVNNVEYVTRNQEHTSLFSGRNVGCYYVKYTMYDKNIFYDNLFGIEMEDAVEAIQSISTIPSNFSVARDDINLVTFYMAHRFLSNPDLPLNLKNDYAAEALHYFNYRTLVHLSGKYFQYPISQDKATTLTEQLSAKFLIKNVKNWNEYCHYRSTEFLNSKFRKTLFQFTDDTDIPKAISDLYARTNDALKNIYGEFTVMLKRNEILASRSSTITDFEGNDSVVEHVDGIYKYIGTIDVLLTDKSSLIRRGHLGAVTDILPSLSQKDLQQALEYLLDYAYLSRENYLVVSGLFKDILTNAAEYLQRNSLVMHAKSDVVSLMNSLVGNVLYARGTNVSVHELKSVADKVIRRVYKHFKATINDRNTANIRNGLYLYVVLMAITH